MPLASVGPEDRCSECSRGTGPKKPNDILKAVLLNTVYAYAASSANVRRRSGTYDTEKQSERQTKYFCRQLR